MSDFDNISPRRVVIGLTGEGRSAVIIDDKSPHVVASRYSGIYSNMLWKESPEVDRDSRDDQAVVWQEIPVPVDGTRFYVVRIGGHVEAEMHATPSIEYHYVVQGRIVITLEDGEVEVNAGDTVIMRGVLHGWRNESDEPFVSVATMVGMHSSWGVSDFAFVTK